MFVCSSKISRNLGKGYSSNPNFLITSLSLKFLSFSPLSTTVGSPISSLSKGLFLWISKFNGILSREAPLRRCCGHWRTPSSISSFTCGAKHSEDSVEDPLF